MPIGNNICHMSIDTANATEVIDNVHIGRYQTQGALMQMRDLRPRGRGSS